MPYRVKTSLRAFPALPMPQTFLTTPTPTHSTNPTNPTNLTNPSPQPSREKVTLTLRGSAPNTELVIHELYRVGFAKVPQWRLRHR
jgi:hypothetical protein